MFNYRLIHKARLKQLEVNEIKMQKLHQVYRWFSGWKDLDIIWNYIFEDFTPTLEDVRKKYAEHRGTTVYGEPKND